MKRIATLTLNPTIDVGYEVAKIFPRHKMRTLAEHYDPGGGGINVARVFVRLGGQARCVYLSGGATGVALDGLLDLHQLVRHKVPIAGHTRVSTNAIEREGDCEYRFVPAGPTVSEDEAEACLAELDKIECDILVASGSLPPGMAEDFYGQVKTRMDKRGVAMVLDSSGAGLAGGLAAGGLLLVKPSIGELRALTGSDLADDAAVGEAAMGLVRQGRAQHVAVSMGHLGALLASGDGVRRLPAVQVEAKSAVGAGDSFVAAMVFALSRGESIGEAFRLGLAAGAAAVLNPGTGLAHPEDIRRLHALVPPLE